MEYLIGLDIGTSGTKTVLFDTQGNTVASATEEYPLYQPQNGWAEQDPEDWWNAAVKTISQVLSLSGVQPQRAGAAPQHHLVRSAHRQPVRGDYPPGGGQAPD